MIDGMRILVGVDGSAAADNAFKEAVAIAEKFSGSIQAITVYAQGMEQKAEEILEGAQQFCLPKSVECLTLSILGSNPARAIQETAKNGNFDLIVVGSRGLGSTAAILLGSVSRQVIANAECNVLVVKK